MTDFENMTWSFSRVNSYNTCPYAWYLNYIEKNKDEGSAFSEVGTLIHEILEKYAKGELSLFEISDYYEEHFNDAVQHEFPPSKVDLRQKYYDDCIEYLNNVNLPFDDYDILGVEKRVEFYIGKYKFVGYIDLLLRNKETGGIVILDHKSSNLKFKKNGDISKTDQEHFLAFKRQLYLYSKAVIEEYGEKPEALTWNLFRLGKFHSIPWKQSEYDEAISWAEKMIEEITNEALWLPNNSSKYFCDNICGQRMICEFKE